MGVEVVTRGERGRVVQLTFRKQVFADIAAEQRACESIVLHVQCINGTFINGLVC